MRIVKYFFVILVMIVGCHNNTSPNKSKKSDNIGLNIGNKAPEIIEKDVNGKSIKLSDLRGKMVLIDFWASWCPPCRAENPNVVANYHTFKDSTFRDGQGFTVFSVSLDKNKDKWEEAIADDKLSWNYHVSDLQHWNSKAAAIYKVQSIPSNFLINGDGIIVAKDLREEDLGISLTSYLE